MKKSKRLTIALISLILFSVIIYSTNQTVLLFPSQEVESRGELEFGGLTKEFLIIQEITMKKELLSAVEIIISSSSTQYLIDNTFTLLDAKYNVLYKQNFTNENLYKPKYRLFKFPEKIHIGKGEKVIICLSTKAGDKNNHLSVPKDTAGKIGQLSVMPVVNEDIIVTLKGVAEKHILQGSLLVRTYEAHYSFLNWFKIVLFFLVLAFALLIIFAEKIKLFVSRLAFVPENIYVVLALVFGLSLVFLTPPLQVHDEIDHFNRSYQLSELNIFQFDQTVPTSLMRLFNDYGKMTFDTLNKNSIDRIIFHNEVELNPQVRSRIYVPHYIFPYIPQTLGIFIGKLFNGSPITLLYTGRVFNLLFSIAFIYFAIRTAPLFKWIFFLLGLMPMTVFLSASLSKDGMVISLAFLLIALFLQFAYDQQKKINIQDWITLFAVSFLVATGRPIYVILIGMFFLIPMHRIGSFKKYVIILMVLITTVFLATQIRSLKPIFQPKITDSTQQALNLTLTTAPSTFEYYGSDLLPKGVNFKEQKSFILNNPIQYMEILFTSVISNGAYYLKGFVGFMGFYRDLPKWHTNFYLFMLIIAALLLSNEDIKIALTNKLAIAAIFIVGVVLIETGLYLIWTPVGHDQIDGVHGRYFIPCAPLFFLLLYNTSLGKYLNIIFSPQKQKQVKTKRKLFNKSASVNIDNKQIILSNSFHLIIVCFSVISLLSTVYVVLTSYYIFLI